jgi:phospholipid-binding lipoprotein MlaA
VLPLLGPSTLRDTAGTVVDHQADPSRLGAEQTDRYAITALELVNTRANLLATTNLLGQIALDPYTFVRDAYLARRQDQVYDGAPPLEEMDDDSAEPPPK